MKYQTGMFVKLNPNFIGTDSLEAPIWGGTNGFISGEVTATYTHKHNKEEHECAVRWMNGKEGLFREVALMNVTQPERDFSAEWIKTKGTLPNDIFALVKTKSGRFVLNLIESNGSYCVGRLPARYTTMITHFALPTVLSGTDPSLIERSLSFLDVVQIENHSLHDAERCFFQNWKMPVPRAIYHPLPTYKSLSDAIDTSPSDAGNGAYALFHLPHNLCDYSVMMNSRS